MRNLFSLSSLDLAAVNGVIISSVVPAVDQPLDAMAERYFQRKPLFINYRPISGSPCATTIRARWARTGW